MNPVMNSVIIALGLLIIFVTAVLAPYIGYISLLSRDTLSQKQIVNRMKGAGVLLTISTGVALLYITIPPSYDGVMCVFLLVPAVVCGIIAHLNFVDAIKRASDAVVAHETANSTDEALNTPPYGDSEAPALRSVQ